jgi:hypothetical protein
LPELSETDDELSMFPTSRIPCNNA